jgi:hypothetical protein
VVLHVGHLRLAQHQTVDQVHAAIQERLTPVGASISRREIGYLFDAYCTLLRASQDIADDHAWQATARAHGGIILSIDGIQPDKGNETIYLVRDVITGRLQPPSVSASALLGASAARSARPAGAVSPAARDGHPGATGTG